MNTHYSDFVIITLLNILAVVCVVIKIIMAVNKRGLNMVPLVWSFFKVYSRNEIYSVSNQKRRLYMRVNNFINLYLYLWIILTLLLIVIYKATSTTYAA